jgi:hypothetical protein
VDFDELNLLDRRREHTPGNKPETHRYLFVRKGFTSRLVDYARKNPVIKLG